MRNQLETNPESFDVFDSGEVNSTRLAEDTAQALDLYVGDDIPEEVFEIALEISEEQDWFNDK
jgi:hypothetical protein